MRVLTLNQESFNAACAALGKKISGSYVPDLVVGILTGGEYVAARLFADTPHASVELRRPSTADKERAGLLFRLLRQSPRWVTDALRIAEARMLAMKTRKRQKRTVELPAEVIRMIEGARRVLVVDDAVDSGATLRDILDAVGRVPGRRELRSAAITVTTSRPLHIPDYYLYHNSTLIRFPWSKDYRKT